MIRSGCDILRDNWKKLKYSPRLSYILHRWSSPCLDALLCSRAPPHTQSTLCLRWHYTRGLPPLHSPSSPPRNSLYPRPQQRQKEKSATHHSADVDRGFLRVLLGGKIGRVGFQGEVGRDGRLGATGGHSAQRLRAGTGLRSNSTASMNSKHPTKVHGIKVLTLRLPSIGGTDGG